MENDFDIVILGRGAAAFSAAIKASEITHGEARIAMMGNGPIGGTCVNVGCVPSKYLLEISHRIYNPSKPRMQGIEPCKVTYDFSTVMNGLRSYVNEARKSKYVDVLKNYPNVSVFDGMARFKDNHTVQILNETGDEVDSVTGSNILIATGSHPSIPNIEGLKETGFLTSDTLWNMKNLPESIAIIGGGAIGLELGQALLHLGSHVTVIEAMDGLLPQTEPEIGQILRSVLEKEGMKFHLRARISSIRKENGEKKIEIITHRGKENILASEILVATGRSANTNTLNLPVAGVNVDGRGQIITDKRMRTSSPGIFAAGDCVSKKLFLETLAAREGVVAAGNMFGQDAQIDYDFTTWAVFTEPQVAGVGMTEQEFSAKNKSCSCRTFSLSNLTKASIVGETEGMIKITVEPITGRITGMHMISPGATDIITEGAYAVEKGYTVEDIIATSHVFPSFSEGVKLAAQSFIRDIKMMSCCVE